MLAIATHPHGCSNIHGGTDGFMGPPCAHMNTCLRNTVLMSQQTQRRLGAGLAAMHPEAPEGGQIYSQHRCPKHTSHPGSTTVSNVPSCCRCYLVGTGCFSNIDGPMFLRNVFIPPRSLVTQMDGSSRGPAAPCNLTSHPGALSPSLAS